MTTLNFQGGATPDVTTSWTAYSKVYSTTAADGVALPTTGRTDSNGNKPIFVSTAQVYWAGRGGSRQLRIGIGSTYSSWYTVGSASAASASGQKPINGIYLNGGNQVVTIDENGSSGFYFGRETGSSGATDGYTNWGQLSGSLVYYQVPNAPTAVSVSQAALENAVNVSWTAPSDNGGTAVTSYSIQWSYNASFSGSTTILTGSSATSYKITNLSYGSTVYAKVSALNTVSVAAGSTSVYSSSASAYLVPPNLPLNGWAKFGTVTGNTWTLEHTVIPALTPETGLLLTGTATSTGGTYSTGATGISKTYTDLTVGRQYIVSGKAILRQAGVPANIYRFAVTGIGNGTSVTLTSTTVGATIPSYTFTATATSHTVEIELAETFTVTATGVQESVAFYDFALTRVATDLPYRLQDNLYSASLVDHFDLATQSVGAYWWVDKNNVTQFAQDFNYVLPTCTFSDVTADGNIYYSNIATSFDTSTVINDITFNNIGERVAALGSDYFEEYEVEWNESSASSVTNWGARKYELTTNLRTPVNRYNFVSNPTAAYGSENIANGSPNSTLQRVLLTDVNNGATGNLSTGTTQPYSSSGLYVMRHKTTVNQSSLAIFYNLADKIPVQPGVAYYAGISLRAGVGHSASLTGRVSIRWYNSDGVEISTINGTAGTVTSTGWGRFLVVGTAPAGAYFAAVIPFFLYSGANNANFVYYYTCAEMWQSDSRGLYEFFTGDSVDNATDVYQWEGEPGNSRSIRYDNIMDTRTGELLADFATPIVRVESLRWNTAQNPVVAATLDIGSLVNITFKGTTALYRVVGINHDITPERWMMQLQVAKVT